MTTTTPHEMFAGSASGIAGVIDDAGYGVGKWTGLRDASPTLAA